MLSLGLHRQHLPIGDTESPLTVRDIVLPNRSVQSKQGPEWATEGFPPKVRIIPRRTGSDHELILWARIFSKLRFARVPITDLSSPSRLNEDNHSTQEARLRWPSASVRGEAELRGYSVPSRDWDGGQRPPFKAHSLRRTEGCVAKSVLKIVPASSGPAHRHRGPTGLDAKRLADRFDHTLLASFAEFRVDRQRENLATGPFGFGELSRLVAQ